MARGRGARQESREVRGSDLECGENRRFGCFLRPAAPARTQNIQSGDSRRTPNQKRSPETFAAPRTSGLPKKSRTCGQADGMLIDWLLGCGKSLARQQVRHTPDVKDFGTRSRSWNRSF